MPVDAKDRRFADPAWNGNPLFYGVRLSYLAACRAARDVVARRGPGRRDGAEGGGRDGADARRARPDELPADEPGRAEACVRHRPGSAWPRARATSPTTWCNNEGRPRQVDTSPFEVGRNLAATPAKVVYRNDLMELLQYEPQTEQVHANPLLCSPPWINKYYVMDLAPDRSFIEWAVQHGRTVFAISYKNADEGDVRRHAGRLPRPRSADRPRRHPGDHRRRDDRHRRTVPRAARSPRSPTRT